MKKVKKYGPSVLVVLGVAFTIQYLVICYLPQGLYKIATVLSGKPFNTIINAPKTDASLRKVVLPNPDFIYSAVFYDLSEGDVVFSGEFPDTSQYSCVGFYGNDLQPYYVLNNRNASGSKFSFTLTKSVKNSDDVFRVRAPTDKGSILMRMLVSDSTQLSRAMHIQKGLKMVVP